MTTKQPFRQGDTVFPDGDVAMGTWRKGVGYIVESTPQGFLFVRDERGAPYQVNHTIGSGGTGIAPLISFDRMPITESCGDPFEDQRRFMHSMGQETHRFDRAQVSLYLRLTAEELRETLCAAAPSARTRLTELFNEVESLCRVEDGYDEVELLDGLQDVLVTTIGAGVSAAFPMNEAWNEVLKTNLAKVDPATGAVRRRADGKVLKPEGWVGPTQRLRELLARRGASGDV